jgi:hypothetical protein
MTRWFRLWHPNGPGLVFHDTKAGPTLFSVRNRLGHAKYQLRIGKWIIHPAPRMRWRRKP